MEKGRRKRDGIRQNAGVKRPFSGKIHRAAVRKMLSAFEMKNAIKVIDPPEQKSYIDRWTSGGCRFCLYVYRGLWAVWICMPRPSGRMEPYARLKKK